MLEALLFECTLFMHENLLQVYLMNLLICVVYTKLLKAVVIKNFKAIYIQQFNYLRVREIKLWSIKPQVQLAD